MSPVTGMAPLAGWILSSVHRDDFSPVTATERRCDHWGVKFNDQAWRKMLQNFSFLSVLQTSKLSYLYLYYWKELFETRKSKKRAWVTGASVSPYLYPAGLNYANACSQPSSIIACEQALFWSLAREGWNRESERRSHGRADKQLFARERGWSPRLVLSQKWFFFFHPGNRDQVFIWAAFSYEHVDFFTKGSRSQASAFYPGRPCQRGSNEEALTVIKISCRSLKTYCEFWLRTYAKNLRKYGSL